ncbi:MAG: alpha/beta hydrolase [Candidatus Nanopelagicales bacterium]
MTGTDIRATSVLPAERRPITLRTSDGLTLVGEAALPLGRPARATLVCVHPLPTHGGMMDSHVLRKASWRLPALADIAVVRFNTRGTTSAAGTSEGSFDASNAEGLDLAAAVAWVREQGLPDPWLLGWSFGSDVVLRHGPGLDPAGIIALSPPLRFTSPEELRRWNDLDCPVVCLVPEEDDFLRPEEARERFSVVPRAQILIGPGMGHLWVGEPAVRTVLAEIVARLRPDLGPLDWEWPAERAAAEGEMERWSDL